MTVVTGNMPNNDFKSLILLYSRYLLRYWYFIVIAGLTSALIGYFFVIRIKPIYTATYNFVLSTDQGNGAGSVSGLASQLGLNNNSSGDIFAGDNIIELFKSRKLIGTALQTVIDSTSNRSLLNLIVQKHYGALNNNMGIFSHNPNDYTSGQTELFRAIITQVAKSFIVFKRDKKLIFYSISSTDSDGQIAYYVAKFMLYQASKYFIETKTKGIASSVTLLKHEADTLSHVLNNAYNSSATVVDRTYNLNPAITIQRSGIQFSQTRAAAYGSAYSDVLRNLESAKLNLQNATPLYRIIDEPELPLIPEKPNKIINIGLAAILGIFLMIALLITDQYIKLKNINAI